MPAVSQIIACPAGQWTSIAQYMETRQSMLVQCPVSPTTTTYTATACQPATLIAAANPLRKSLMIHNGKPTVASGFVLVGTNATDVGTNNGIMIGPVPNAIFGVPGLQVDESWGEWAQKAWYATAPFLGAGLGLALTFEEIFTCESIILGINTLPAQTSGNPIGIWQTPDLMSGPSEFRLDRVTDADLVIQEWFAWPVGSGTVNVQVFQAFDVPVNFTTMTVQIPGLSPHGKRAAQELLAAMQSANNANASFYRSDDNNVG